MAALAVSCGHHIEKKRLYIIVERFMVEEKFGQQTEILAVLLVTFTVDFPNTQSLFANEKKNVRMFIEIQLTYR